jgi:hypothetical protein
MSDENLYKLIELNINSLTIPTDNVIEYKPFIEDYQCMIQFHLPINPVQCSKCESLICKSCLQEQQAIDERCPSCRDKLVPKELNRIVRSTLDKFFLKCPNPECTEPVKYSKYTKHYMECDYTPRESICTGCDTIIKTNNKLKEIKEHNKFCNLKEHCKFCYRIFLYKDLNIHLEQCEVREISCPYCSAKYPYSQAKSHWSKECFTSYIDKREEELNKIIKEKDEKLSKIESIVKQSGDGVGSYTEINKIKEILNFK